MKVKRSGEGEDGMEFGRGDGKWPGGLIGGEEALFIVVPTLHAAPLRGGERGWKNGGSEDLVAAP